MEELYKRLMSHNCKVEKVKRTIFLKLQEY